jgi:hypothetical protein
MMDIPPISLVGNGAADTFIIGSLHSPDGSMGGIGTDASLTGRHEGHGDNIGLTGISRFNPVCQESSPDHTPVYPELAGQFQLRFASYITFDKLVEIRHIYHSGHVFDLQSIHGLYTCNGVFVKNCRCTELYGF